MEPGYAPYQILMQAFPGIAEAEAIDIISAGIMRSFPAGAVLCNEGEWADTFYIIFSGSVKVTKLVNADEERVMNTLSSGTFFGEMAIIHDAPRAATVTTTQPTTVLEVHKEAFSGMLENHKSVSLAIIREVSRRLRENDEMAIEDLRAKAGELADAYQQLAEEEYARSQFLTNIAHELRTPLTAANGFLQVIRSGMLQGEALNAALETVGRHLQDISTLTNDILFLQEMELILPAFQPTDLLAVISAAIQQQRVKTGIRLEIPPNLPKVSADPRSLQRAVAAIIENGVKFSPDGGEVCVQVSQEPGWINIAVQDHGVGIPPEVMPRIFQRFFHLDQMGGHLFRGVGIGLSIARQVIEQHNGQITVASEAGKGSTFTIRLRAE